MIDGRVVLLALLVGAVAPTVASAQLPVLTPTPTATPSATPTAPPEPTPSPSPAPSTLTLVAPDKPVALGRKLRLHGQASPDLAGKLVEVDGSDPVQEESVAQATISADGSFVVTIAPRANGSYRAQYAHTVMSDRIRVFVDYGGRVRWRHRSRGRIEALAILNLLASDFDTLAGHRLFLYAFDSRRDTTARRLVSVRMGYTDNESSNGRPGAYFKGRVPAARRVRYLLACVPYLNRYYGAPDGAVRRGCGRARIAF